MVLQAKMEDAYACSFDHIIIIIDCSISYCYSILSTTPIATWVPLSKDFNKLEEGSSEFECNDLFI